MTILHVDTNHPLLIDQLAALGHANDEDYTSSKTEIQSKISSYDGLVIRSRFTIDKTFLDCAANLKFIGRVGAGLENIDVNYAAQKGIHLIAAPEGNRNAVGEHALGMLLSLFNKLNQADKEVRQGLWKRESNRGIELDGKTVGIIGYGNMGQAFAKKLKGFDVKVLCYDIKPNVGNDDATQVSLEEFQKQVDVVSLHTPQTPQTIGLINTNFIQQFAKPFWLLNTARGRSVITKDLVLALESGQILGAGLDVLEYENNSFENLFTKNDTPQALQQLMQSKQVILSPHVAGWTVESHQKLAQIIIDKIKHKFH
jgi:D-3-phosphoglycerate dehydrogenase